LGYWSEYTRFFIALVAILTPFAAVPIFLALTDGRSAADKRRIAVSAALTVFCVLAGAAFGGDVVLRIVGTSLDSFRVGGGIVLLLMALSMLNAQVSRVQQTKGEADEAGQRSAIGVVPLGLPLLAGPGSISTVIIEGQRHPEWSHQAALVAVIAAVAGVIWATLAMAAPLGARLGQTGLNILNRLFGLLLAAIAVEIIASGLRGLFPGWMT
jgi:multiple antibiotic resistance protein